MVGEWVVVKVVWKDEMLVDVKVALMDDYWAFLWVVAQVDVKEKQQVFELAAVMAALPMKR